MHFFYRIEEVIKNAHSESAPFGQCGLVNLVSQDVGIGGVPSYTNALTVSSSRLRPISRQIAPQPVSFFGIPLRQGFFVARSGRPPMCSSARADRD